MSDLDSLTEALHKAVADYIASTSRTLFRIVDVESYVAVMDDSEGARRQYRRSGGDAVNSPNHPKGETFDSWGVVELGG